MTYLCIHQATNSQKTAVARNATMFNAINMLYHSPVADYTMNRSADTQLFRCFHRS